MSEIKQEIKEFKIEEMGIAMESPFKHIILWESFMNENINKGSFWLYEGNIINIRCPFCKKGLLKVKLNNVENLFFEHIMDFICSENCGATFHSNITHFHIC